VYFLVNERTTFAVLVICCAYNLLISFLKDDYTICIIAHNYNGEAKRLDFELLCEKVEGSTGME